MKLHGSMNLGSCGACGLILYSEADVISSTLQSGAYHGSLPVTCASCGGTDVSPLMVPPGQRKSIPASLDSLWDKAGERLQESEAVIILGYSLPSYDSEARRLLSGIKGKHVIFVNPRPTDDAVNSLKTQSPKSLEIIPETFSDFFRKEGTILAPSFIQAVTDLCSPLLPCKDEMEGISRW